jgi:hypothetical protein
VEEEGLKSIGGPGRRAWRKKGQRALDAHLALCDRSSNRLSEVETGDYTDHLGQAKWADSKHGNFGSA